MVVEYSSITADDTLARAGPSRVLFDIGQALVIDGKYIAVANFDDGRLVRQDLEALTGTPPLAQAAKHLRGMCRRLTDVTNPVTEPFR